MTERQRRFAEFYLECGNARKAAVKAGYSLSYAEHVKNQRSVRNYIDKLAGMMGNERIASADEVLEFLTDVMRGNKMDRNGISLQIKAAEMISRRMGYIKEDSEAAGQ